MLNRLDALFRNRSPVALAGAASAIWLTVDITSGNQYSYDVIRYWNAGVRLGFFIVTSSLLASLREHLRIEEGLARRDSLTGVLNSRAFGEASQSLFDLARRHQRPLALGYVDFDNFKLVNDSLGHAEGDRVLQSLARAMSERLRQTDLIGRLGGDEFAILLPDTDADGAATLFATMRTSAAAEIEKNRWPVSLSVGVVTFRAGPPPFEEALQLADALMYSVKSEGKNGLAMRPDGGDVPFA